MLYCNIFTIRYINKSIKELGANLTVLNWVDKVEPVETNIVIFSVKRNFNYLHIIEFLKQEGIFISALGTNKLRMVTHLDYTEEMHLTVLEKLQTLVFL